MVEIYSILVYQLISGTEYYHFVYIIFFPGSAAFRTFQGSPFLEIFYQVASEYYQTSSLKEMRCRISDEMKRRETVHLLSNLYLAYFQCSFFFQNLGVHWFTPYSHKDQKLVSRLIYCFIPMVLSRNQMPISKYFWNLRILNAFFCNK